MLQKYRSRNVGVALFLDRFVSTTCTITPRAFSCFWLNRGGVSGLSVDR